VAQIIDSMLFIREHCKNSCCTFSLCDAHIERLQIARRLWKLSWEEKSCMSDCSSYNRLDLLRAARAASGILILYKLRYHVDAEAILAIMQVKAVCSCDILTLTITLRTLSS